MAIKTTRKQDFRIYKPNKTGNGAASAFQVRVDLDEETQRRKIMLFLMMAPQTGKDDNGNSAFGWKDNEKTVTVKLGMPDIGDMLAVLNGRKTEVGTGKGLFHKNANGSTSLSFALTPGGYSLRTNKKIGDKVGEAVSHSLTHSEGEVLKVLLEEVVKITYNWIL